MPREPFAAIQAVPDPPRLSRAQVKDTAFWTMIVALIGLTLIMLLAMIALSRRRHRRHAPPPAPAAPQRDAWVEAGRRVAIPTAGELETDAGPTDIPSHAGNRPVVLITGAARRVGRAIALEFARAGCDVLFTYHESEPEAHSLAREIAALGVMSSFFQLDLADTDATEAFASHHADLLPRLDVVVHNASTYDPSPLSDLTVEAALLAYRVNALAPLVMTARLAPLLRRSPLPGGAAVIAISDIHALGRPRKDFVTYAMSKAALGEMVRTLARDLAPEVRVNAVAPGVVAWPEEGEESDPLAQQRYLRRIPLGRAGTPGDAAGVVRWLALEATYITGEVIRVDGGRWLT